MCIDKGHVKRKILNISLVKIYSSYKIKNIKKNVSRHTKLVIKSSFIAFTNIKKKLKKKTFKLSPFSLYL